MDTTPPPPAATPDPTPVAGPPAIPPSTPVSAPRHRGPRWRWALAGGVAGGMLAAAVAVPITLQVADRPASSAVAGSPATGTTPGGVPGQLPGGSDGSDGSGGYGGFGQDTLPGATTQAAGTAATDAQSKGVLLVDTQLTNGAGAGTAMVLDSSGLALTNYHVVENSTSIKATVASTGETYDATVVGFDENADVALIQLADASGLDTVTVDDDAVAVGDAVTGVGNASGQGRLLAAAGKITAEDQSITTSDGAGANAATEDLTGLLETDAAVVPGYSGGPMYDAEGEVVGISTAASSSNGMAANGSTAADSYAVPIGDALTIVHQIEAGDESGDVQIGPSAYLGIGAADGTGGVAVDEVEADGPAADAGMAAGSTITALDGTKVGSLEALLAALADHEPGDRVQVTWTGAQGASRTATVTLGESPVA